LSVNDNKKPEILQDIDIRSGKERPWRPKKMRNLILANSFGRQGQEKKSERVRYCGYRLDFQRDPESLRLTLKKAWFCRERLCPMCQWRRSLRVFKEVSRVMGVAMMRYGDELAPLFLTLTVRNCFGGDLFSVLEGMFEGWKNYFDHRRMRKIFKGWFRALEVTYDKDKVIGQRRYNKHKDVYDRQGIKPGDENPNYDTYHPHFHVVLLVEKGYFAGKDYMQTTEWVKRWRTAAGLDYDPVCHICKVKNRPGKARDIADVAKYTLKDADFLTKDKDLTDKHVSILGDALRSRRLYAFGGLLKEIAKELKADKPDEGDLVDPEDTIREDVATVLVSYQWNIGFGNYVKIE